MIDKGFKLIIVFLCMLFSFAGFAQCPAGIVHLSSDEEIIAFSKKYPNCTELDSSLIIGPNVNMTKTRITDISSLPKFKSVNGNCIISGNPWLKSMSRLQSIEVVEGNCKLIFERDMDQIAFRSSLIKVGGSMKIVEPNLNSKLNVTFPELIIIGESLDLYTEKEKKGMFPNLWKIGGSIYDLSYSKHFFNGAFPSLESIKWSVYLRYNNGKEIPSNFESLKSVGSITINGNRKGPINIGRIEKAESITIADKFSGRITGFNAIDSLENLKINYASINNINSFKSLVFTRHLSLQYMEETDEIIAFPKLKKVEVLRVLSPDVFPIVSAIDTVTEQLFISNMKEQSEINKLTKMFKTKTLELQKNMVDSLVLKNTESLSKITISNSRNLDYLAGELKSEGERFSLAIKSNWKLNNIEDLTLPESKFEKVFININNNKQLNNCATPMICNALKQSNYKVEFYNNGPDCIIGKVREKCNKSN